MWLLEAHSSETTLMGRRYPSPALLKHTVVAILPEEVTACDYTCLAEEELKDQLRDRSSTFPSCWVALWCTQGDTSHWNIVGAQMQLLFCPVVLYRVHSQIREIKRSSAVISFSVCPKKWLSQWSLYVWNANVFTTCSQNASSPAVYTIFHQGRLRQEAVMNMHEFAGQGTLGTQSCEGPYHFFIIGMQMVLLAGTWLNAMWNQHYMHPLAPVVADNVLNGYVNYKRVKCTGFEEWFYCVLFQRHSFYQKSEELVGWLF